MGLRKPRTYAEIWNDLDGELVNLFQVLRDPTRSVELLAQLRLTPFARAEFNSAYEPCADPVERARRLLVRSFMGHGSDGSSGIYRTGFRSNSNRSGTTPAHDWSNYPACLEIAVQRLRGVVVESRDALEVCAKHDSPETLHYVDPPYLHATRKRANRRPDNGGVYRHELSDEDHARLLTGLTTLQGMVVLSGYPSSSYDDALPGWRRVTRATHADGALPREEVLWLNPAAAFACPQGSLFAEARA